MKPYSITRVTNTKLNSKLDKFVYELACGHVAVDHRGPNGVTFPSKTARCYKCVNNQKDCVNG